MKNTIFILSILMLTSSLTAQHINYNDVGVIVNNNSSTSKEIGEYFKMKRNIPDINIININCSEMERIDSTELFSIINQVSEYIINNNLENTINYLVTTKGVPLIYEGGNCDSVPDFKDCSSVDSELSLIINNTDYIGISQTAQNPYFKSENYNFSQEDFGIYLVTRLDGYTVDDIKKLIDRSGPDLVIDKESAQFILDQAFAQDPSLTSLLSGILGKANDLVISNGWNTIYSPDPVEFITDESNVLGYYSYVFQPSNKTLNYSWLKGSITNQGIGETAFTFYKEENIYNDLILANLIEEGACGGSGTVTFYYLNQGTVWPEVLFHKYTFGLDTVIETNPYYNLAESYWNSISILSSAHVVIGDPKTSIVLKGTSDVQTTNEISHFKVFPIPTNDLLTVEYTIHNSPAVHINVYNIYGEIVYSYLNSNSSARQSHTIDISDQNGGMYIVELISGNNQMRKKILIDK